MFLALRNIVAHLMRCLLRVRLAEVRCVSKVGDKIITLTSEYVRGSQGIHIEFSVHWPLLLPTLKAPAVVLRLISSSGGRLVDPIPCVLTRSARTTRVHFDLAAFTLGRAKDFQLEVVRQKKGQPIGTIHFRAIDVASVASELRHQGLDLLAWQQGTRIRCERLHNAVEQVGFRIELALDDPEHRRFCKQMAVEFQADIAPVTDPHHRLGSWHQPWQTNGRSFRWEQEVGSAPALFGNAGGDYQLSVRLAGNVLASKQFSVTSLAACVAAAQQAVKEHTRVLDYTLSAVNHRGIAVPLDVVAEDFRQIDLSLTVDVPQPEPLLAEVQMNLGMAIRRGKVGLHSHRREITLKPGQRRFHDTLHINPSLFGHGPGHYGVDILLNDRVLTSADFVHKTRAQLKREKAEALLRSLSLAEPHLFALRDGARVETDHLFVTDHAMAPTFCIRGGGFDEDAPALQWRLRLELVNLDSGESTTTSRNLQARAGCNAHQDLELPLPDSDSRGGHYALRLWKRDTMLTEYRFRILSLEEIVPYTETVVLQSLRVDGAQLFIQAGSARYQSPYVSDTNDFLLPEFTVHSAGYNSHLRQLQTRLQLFLLRPGEQRKQIAALPVTLSAQPLDVRNVAIRFRDTSLGVQPGSCRLAIVIADQELSVFTFEVVSSTQVLEQIRVTVLDLEFHTKSGKRLTNPNSLLLSEHEACSVTAAISVGIPAPNLAAECALVLKLDNAVVGHATSQLQLNGIAQVIQGRKISLTSLVPRQSLRQHDLTVTVLIAGEEREARSVAIISAQRITNFEGQLTIDPHNLDVDEAQYQEILSRL